MRSKLCDKRYDFNYLIVKFPLTCSNITADAGYAQYQVYLSESMYYFTVCVSHLALLDMQSLLTNKLLKRWFLNVRLKSGLQANYGRYPELVGPYRESVSQLSVDMFLCEYMTSTFWLECYYSLDFDYGYQNVCPSKASVFIKVFDWGSCCPPFF